MTVRKRLLQIGGAALAAPLAGLLAVGAALPQDALDQDNPWYPLPEGEGVMEVYYACNACHSLRTVTNVRYSRRTWNELLDWMIDEQGMPEFRDSEERQMVLDYLATYLGPDSDTPVAGQPPQVGLPPPTSGWN